MNQRLIGVSMLLLGLVVASGVLGEITGNYLAVIRALLEIIGLLAGVCLATVGVLLLLGVEFPRTRRKS